MYIERVPNRGSKPAVLLRESLRVGGKVVKRTIANLSALPDESVEVLRLSLKGVSLCEATRQFTVAATTPAGHVRAIRSAMDRLGMAELVSSKPCCERDLVLALVAQRLIAPGSKLEASLSFGDTTVPQEFGIPADTDENAIYAAMDWLVGRQPFIEKKLAARHLTSGSMAFYDLSCSSYYGTHCELAKRGYNRDGLKLPAVEYGLLTDREGRPVSVQVYPGNTGDPKTVPDQAKKLKEAFGLDRIVLVGDRGMLTGAQIDEIRGDDAFGWISCLRSEDIRTLLEDRDPSDTPLFSRGNLAEISHPDFPGERLVACFNPFLAEDRTRTRNELLDATEASLAKLQKFAAKRTKKPIPDAELGEMIGKRIGRHKMGKHFAWKVENGNFTFSRKEDEIARERALDGIYVVRTSIPKDAISAEDAVRAYKSLGNVEKAFRTFKGVDILVRPIRHRTNDRVKAHVFLCMLTYYVEWHMRRALSSLLYVEDDLPAARESRDPVAKAKPTSEARRKKTEKTAESGLSIRTWRGMIAALGTLCRTTILVGDAKVPVVRDGTPDAYQSKVFELLAADAPTWPRRCTQ